MGLRLGLAKYFSIEKLMVTKLTPVHRSRRKFKCSSVVEYRVYCACLAKEGLYTLFQGRGNIYPQMQIIRSPQP